MTQICNNQNSMKNNGKCCKNIGDLLIPRFFKALCDPSRTSILARLLESCAPLNVTEIAGCCTVDISVVSRHLGVLRDAGIVNAEKRGKEVYYSVRYDILPTFLRQIADAIESCCPVKSKLEDNSDEKK